MAFLVDTNACIEFLRKKNSHVVAHFAKTAPKDIFLCSIVTTELKYGARRSIDPIGEMAKVQKLILQFVSIPFDDLASDLFVDQRIALESKGFMIGSFDLMIASIALVHSLTLVTHNTAEFSRVHGLSIVDWQIP